MIIFFNRSIFNNQDPNIQRVLADILVRLMHKNCQNHFMDTQNIRDIFFDENNQYNFNNSNIAKEYLGDEQRILLKNYITNIPRRPITNLHRQHLASFTIGIDLSLGEVHPNDAYKIINERSKVIVENGINDWNFITGICQKYSSSKIKRRDIYQLVEYAIKNETLESDHSGGTGEIVKISEKWINSNRYRNIFRYKLMAIFDSDRSSENNYITPNKSQIEFFKQRDILVVQSRDYEYEHSDKLIWHILYKRKIENYVPLDILFLNITSISEQQKSDLRNKSNVELDFIEYGNGKEQFNIGIGETKIKDQFPKIFLSAFSYRDLEERCKHHKVYLPEANEEVSEIEIILLKIAKII
jgi:hypothetical protein